MLEFFIADFILSFDSRTLVSGNPTISNDGKPPVMSVCTYTKLPSIPIKDIVFTFDIIIFSFLFKFLLIFRHV